MRHLFRKLKGRLRPPSAGVVLGTTALIAALSGTAAADLPGVGDVVSNDIRNGEVKSRDIGADTIRHLDINRGAVRSVELRDGGVQAADMGSLDAETNQVSVAPGATGFAIANCDAGEIAISGGGTWVGANSPDLVVNGTFRQSPTNWEIIGSNDSGVSRDLIAHVYCLEA
jgi:hypothetical protein